MLAAVRAFFSPANKHCWRNRIVLPALGGAVLATAVTYFFGYPRRVYHDDKQIDLTAEMYKLKAPSMKAWEGTSIEGNRIGAFSYPRFAMTLKDFKKLAITDTGEGGPIQVSVLMDGMGGVGAATVISHDGYLLTAAHCIDVEPITVVIKGKGRELVELRPRVVWKGRASTKSQPDLALLHVDRTFPSVFTLGDEGGLAVRSPVFASGYSRFEESTSAGVVILAPVAHASDLGVKWSIFEHDAPNTRGDSGGPVFGREGQLLGINVQANTSAWFWGTRPLWWHHRTICHRPDMAWLKEMMEKDRRGRQWEREQKS